MKFFFAYLLIISSSYNCFAKANAPEFNLQTGDKIEAARKTYVKQLNQCKLLLQLAPPKSVDTKALKYVLEQRMPSPRIFEKLEDYSLEDSIQVRLKIAELITKQSVQLQNLIILATKNEVANFNITSQLMLRTFDSIEKLLDQRKWYKSLNPSNKLK